MTVDTVLLKVASRCNLNCKYCYVYHSPDDGWRQQPARMSNETIDKVISRIAELQHRQYQPPAVVLHGGEPLLLKRPRLERLLTGLRSALGPEAKIALQTNGTLLNAELVELFAETRTAVAVSVDGPAMLNDRFRVDLIGRSTHSAAVAAIRLLRSHPDSAEFFRGTLAVVDPHTEPDVVYQFFKELDVPSIDFLFRDGNHDRMPFGKASFESHEYGQWMARLWALYIADPDPVPVECLDNLVRSLFGQGTKEGSGTTNFGILIVETDGTITKNDTLKNSHNGADRFCENWSVHKHSFAEVTQADEYIRYCRDQAPSHKSCQQCPILKVCGGGMMLHRWSSKDGYHNPSVYCADQQYLAKRVLATLEQLPN